MADKVNITVEAGVGASEANLSKIINKLADIVKALDDVGKSDKLAPLTNTFKAISDALTIDKNKIDAFNTGLAQLGTGDGANAMTNINKIAAAFSAMASAGNPTGKILTVTEELKKLKEVVTPGAFNSLDELKTKLGSAKDLIPQATLNRFTALGKACAYISSLISGPTLTSITQLTGALTTLATAPDPTAPVKSLKDAIAALKTALNSTTATNITQLSNAFKIIGKEAPKLTSAADGIIAIVDPMTKLKAVASNFAGPNMTQLGVGLKSISDGAKLIKSGMGAALTDVSTGLAAIKTATSGTTGVSLTNTSKGLGDMITAISKIDGSKVQAIKDVGTALDTIRKGAPASVSKNLNIMGEALKNFALSVKDVGKINIKSVATALQSIVYLAKANVSTNLGNIGLALKSLAIGVTPDVIDRIKQLASELKKLGTANYSSVIASMKALTKQVNDLTAQQAQNSQQQQQNKTALGGTSDAVLTLSERMKKLSQASAMTTFSNMVDALVVLKGAFNFAKQFADFEYIMANIKALTGASTTTMKAMGDAIIAIGTNSLYSVKEAADAMLVLASAGLTASEAIVALPKVLDLATAGGISIAQAADTAVSAMFGLNMQASDMGHIMDVLAVGAAKSNATIGSLAESLKNAAPAGTAANQSLESIVATVASLSNAGFKGATAGQNYKRMLMALVEPSQKAQAMLDKLGVSVQGTNGEMRDFNTIIAELGASGMKLSESKQIFGMWSGTAALAAATATDSIARLKMEMDNSAGAMRNIAAAMEDTLTGASKKAVNQLQALVIMLGSQLGDGLKGLMQMISAMASSLISWAQNMGPIEAFFLKLTAIVPVLSAALLLLSSGFMRVVRAGALIFEYMTGFNTLLISAGSGIKTYAKATADLASDMVTAGKATNAIGGIQLGYVGKLKIARAETALHSAQVISNTSAIELNNAAVSYGTKSSQYAAAMDKLQTAAKVEMTAAMRLQTLQTAAANGQMNAMTLASVRAIFTMGGLRTALIAVKTALMGMFSSNPLGLLILGISVAVSAWMMYTNRQKEAQKAGEETAKAMIQGIKDIESAQKELDTASTPEKRSAAASEYRNKLLDIAVANKAVAKEALAATESIDSFTGDIRDSGVAIEALKAKMGTLKAENFLVEADKKLQEYNKELVKLGVIREKLEKAKAKSDQTGLKEDRDAVIELQLAFDKAATAAEATKGQITAFATQTAMALHDAGKIKWWMEPEQAVSELMQIKGVNDKNFALVLEQVAKIRIAEKANYDKRKEEAQSSDLSSMYTKSVEASKRAFDQQGKIVDEIKAKLTELKGAYAEALQNKDASKSEELLLRVKQVTEALTKAEQEGAKIAEKYGADLETAHEKVSTAIDRNNSRLQSFTQEASKVDAAWKTVMDSMSKSAPTSDVSKWGQEYTKVLDQARLKSNELATTEESNYKKTSGMSEKKSKAIMDAEDKKTKAIIASLSKMAAHYESVYNKAKSKAEEYATVAMDQQDKIKNAMLEAEDFIFKAQTSTIKNAELKNDILRGRMDGYKSEAQAVAAEMIRLDATGDFKGSKKALADLEGYLGKIKTGTQEIATAEASVGIEMGNSAAGAEKRDATIRAGALFEADIRKKIVDMSKKQQEVEESQAKDAAARIQVTKDATDQLIASVQKLVTEMQKVAAAILGMQSVDIEAKFNVDPTAANKGVEDLRQRYVAAFGTQPKLGVDNASALKSMEALEVKEQGLREKLKTINIALDPEDYKLTEQLIQQVITAKHSIKIKVGAETSGAKDELSKLNAQSDIIKSVLENLSPSVDPDKYAMLQAQLYKLGRKRDAIIRVKAETNSADTKLDSTTAKVDALKRPYTMNIDIKATDTIPELLSKVKSVDEAVTKANKMGISIDADSANQTVVALSSKITELEAQIVKDKKAGLTTDQAQDRLGQLKDAFSKLVIDISASNNEVLLDTTKAKLSAQDLGTDIKKALSGAASEVDKTNTQMAQRFAGTMTMATGEIRKVYNDTVTAARTSIAEIEQAEKNATIARKIAVEQAANDRQRALDIAKVRQDENIKHETAVIELEVAKQVITREEANVKLKALEDARIQEVLDNATKELSIKLDLYGKESKEYAKALADQTAAQDVKYANDQKRINEKITESKKTLAEAKAGMAALADYFNSVTQGTINLVKDLSDNAFNALMNKWNEASIQAAKLTGYRQFFGELRQGKDTIDSVSKALSDSSRDLGSLQSSLTLATGGLTRWALQNRIDGAVIKQAFMEQKLEVMKLEDALTKAWDSGSEGLLAMSAQAESAIGKLNLLDNTQLDSLKGQIDKIKQAIVSFTDSVVSALKSLQDEFDNLTLNKVQLEEKRYQDQRVEWERQYAEARRLGSQQAMDDLQKQLNLIEQIHKIKMVDAASADASSTPGRTKMATGGKLPGGDSLVDSVHVLARPGEWFVRNESANHWGNDIMAGINDPWSGMGQRVSAALTGTVNAAKFAVGGQVNSSAMGSMRFSAGGKVPDLSSNSGIGVQKVVFQSPSGKEVSGQFTTKDARDMLQILKEAGLRTA